MAWFDHFLCMCSQCTYLTVKLEIICVNRVIVRQHKLAERDETGVFFH